jgi:hypothetical protein
MDREITLVRPVSMYSFNNLIYVTYNSPPRIQQYDVNCNLIHTFVFRYNTSDNISKVIGGYSNSIGDL